jgi:hypothetical protein
MQIGTQVKATIRSTDSFYKAVIGELVEVKNGWAKVRATQVMDKWSKSFEQHPTSCLVHAYERDLEAV